MQDDKLIAVCRRMLEELLAVRQGEVITITCDTESDMTVVESTFQAACDLKAIPIILKVTAPSNGGRAGESELPVCAITAALCESDIWIEYNAKWLFSTAIFDDTEDYRISRLRYINVSGAMPEMMIRNLESVDFSALQSFTGALADFCQEGQRWQIRTEQGTDLVCMTNAEHPVLSASPAFRSTRIGKLPGQISWSPDFDSVNGTVVLDGSIHPWNWKMKSPIRLKIERGYIIRIEGDSEDVEKYTDMLNAYQDPNMFLIAQISVGFSPRAERSGCMAEDERVWGDVVFELGNVASEYVMDIPEGIPAESNICGTACNCSLWVDDIQILDNGRIVGPDTDIVRLAGQLRKS